MQAKCVLCDKITQLDDESIQTKRLRNRHIDLYLCPTCYKRISDKTMERHATGKFKLYRDKKDNFM